MNKSKKQKWLEKVLSFWLSFALGYVIYRYVFGAGHLASSFAYATASLQTILQKLEEK